MCHQSSTYLATISPGASGAGILNRRLIGAGYERQARHYLERAGLVFVAANVAVRGGELDLIMRDGNAWVFVEVRYRRSVRFGGAAASVTRAKQRRLLHAAAVWLAQRGTGFDNADCRFDVLAVTGNQCDWIQNAFDAQG